MKWNPFKKKKPEAEPPDPPDHIGAAYNAMYIFAQIYETTAIIDLGLLTKEDQKRIRQIKRQSLRILHAHLQAEYESLFGKDDDD